MAEAALRKLEDRLKCSVCLDTYTDPKQLQCDHVYCQGCLEGLVVSNQHMPSILACPNCRQVTRVPVNGVASLRTAFQTNHLLDILKEHKKAKEGTLYCASHEGRELELYCESCEQLICLQCSITGHNGHNMKLVNDIIQKHKLEIGVSLAPAKEQLATISRALELIDSQKRQVRDQQVTLEANIRQDSQRLIAAISARTQELTSKLQRISEEKLRCLNTQMEQLEAMKTQLSSYLDMVEETLAVGDLGKVVSMKTTIARQVNELTTSLQTDTPIPALADMEYSTAGIAVEVCQNYGGVHALSSPDPSMCRVTGGGLEVATVGETASVVLEAINFKGQPSEIPIMRSECELVSIITGSRTRGSVERRGQSQYEINYQSTIKGRHQLHVKVEGQHIRGSPFEVAVKSSVEKLGSPMLSIDDVKGPWCVAINQSGEVVVTEWHGHCVSVFSPSGEKLWSFGKRGPGQGQFEYPAGVAVDCYNNILVVDWHNDRIQKFTSDGQFLAALGTCGNGPLQFSGPRGIAVNSSNSKVYVTDQGNHRVQVLNSDLTFSKIFGKKGSEKGQFDWPSDIACDNSGNVYVVDYRNHRIQVFTAEGEFLQMFGRRGGEMGELEYPRGVTVDANDLVYVSAQGNNSVTVFTCGGRFVTSSFGRKGAEEGEFNGPTGMAVDIGGVVYVCDCNNDRVQLF